MSRCGGGSDSWSGRRAIPGVRRWKKLRNTGAGHGGHGKSGFLRQGDLQPASQGNRQEAGQIFELES